MLQQHEEAKQSVTEEVVSKVNYNANQAITNIADTKIYEGKKDVYENASDRQGIPHFCFFRFCINSCVIMLLHACQFFVLQIRMLQIKWKLLVFGKCVFGSESLTLWVKEH